jgi:hypothetical protein
MKTGLVRQGLLCSTVGEDGRLKTSSRSFTFYNLPCPYKITFSPFFLNLIWQDKVICYKVPKVTLCYLVHRTHKWGHSEPHTLHQVFGALYRSHWRMLANLTLLFLIITCAFHWFWWPFKWQHILQSVFCTYQTTFRFRALKMQLYLITMCIRIRFGPRLPWSRSVLVGYNTQTTVYWSPQVQLLHPAEQSLLLYRDDT